MRRLSSSMGRLATALAIAIALICGAGLKPAHAVLDEWGTFTAGDTRFCEAGVCGGDFIQIVEDGGLLQPFSSVAFVPDDPATSPGNDFAAEAALVDAVALPELKALAIAPVTAAVPPTGPGRFISTATAEAVQGYEYSGSTSTTVTLNALLDGSVTGFGSISGFVGVFEAGSFERLGEFHGVRLAATTFLLDASQDIEPEPLEFTLEPGDQFYVWAALFAAADSRDATPSSADAFHTLTMAFDDPTGLVPATAVPEPDGGALVVFGMLMLAAAARAHVGGVRALTAIRASRGRPDRPRRCRTTGTRA